MKNKTTPLDKLTKLNRERNLKRLADRGKTPLQLAMEEIEKSTSDYWAEPSDYDNNFDAMMDNLPDEEL